MKPVPPVSKIFMSGATGPVNGLFPVVEQWPSTQQYRAVMVNRTRAAYDDSVPAALRAARAEFDEATARYEAAVADAREAWAAALAEAVDAGMSYREVAAEVGVSPTSISAALKSRG